MRSSPSRPAEPQEEDDRGEHHELDEPERDVDQRQVRRDDPGRRDADGYASGRRSTSVARSRRDAEQRQQADADREEERVREQEPDHDGSLTRAT